MSEVPTATHPDKNHESPGTIHPVYHGVLYGVGVGPGSPDLVTLRAVDILKGVQHVIAPTIDEQLPGRAETIIRSIIPDINIERFVFPVSDENTSEHNRAEDRQDSIYGRDAIDGNPAEDGKSVRDIDSIYGQLVDNIASYTTRDESVAFITLGDPDIYSTFSHLRNLYIKKHPHMPLETVPGICAFQELAAKTNTTLCTGTDTLILTSHLHPSYDHPDIVERHDSTIVVYKGGARVMNIVELAERNGKIDNAIVGIHLGQEGETIASLKEMRNMPQIPYLSTIVMPCRKY